MARSPRAIALVATYNEELFIASCLRNLIEQGFSVYLLDHESTDRTVELAEPFLGRGLLAIERFPRGDGVYRLDLLLGRKEELSQTLDAEWFLHSDCDEIRLPPRGEPSLIDTVAAADAAGCNVVNFRELTFLPTQAAPDHRHPRFAETMRWYYAFEPRPYHQLTLWKRFEGSTGLVESRGHHIHRPDRAIYRRTARFKHYPVLSAAHAIAKYGRRRHDPAAVAQGFHGWRARLSGPVAAARPDLLVFPAAAELRETRADDDLDTSSPEITHRWLEAWAGRVAALEAQGGAGEGGSSDRLGSAGDRELR